MRFSNALRLAVLGYSPRPLGEPSLRAKFLPAAFELKVRGLLATPPAFWTAALRHLVIRF
jgi:hypothetical protein